MVAGVVPAAVTPPVPTSATAPSAGARRPMVIQYKVHSPSSGGGNDEIRADSADLSEQDCGTNTPLLLKSVKKVSMSP